MKILALTLDPSLEAALTMTHDWDLVTVHDLDDAIAQAENATALLIGVGRVDAGIERAQDARGKGFSTPIIVVGEGDVIETDVCQVLYRPFSLEDLRDSVARAMDMPRASVPAVDPPGVVQPESEPEPETESEPEPEPEREPESDTVEEPDAQVLTDVHPAANGSASPANEEVHDPEPAHAEGPGRVERFEDPDLADLDVAEVVAPREEAARSLTLVPETTETVEEAHVVEAPAGSTPAQPVRAEPDLPPIPDRREAVPAAGTPGLAESALLDIDDEPVRESRRERRRRKKAQRSGGPEGSPFTQRLWQAARSAQVVDQLVTELPVLRDARTLAGALVAEVGDRLSTEVAVVLLQKGDGFAVAADIGLSKVERDMRIGDDHPILNEVRAEGDPESLLIAPIDLAQGVVGGVPGARTHALMASPITVDGWIVGLIVVGARDFRDEDLDTLDRLAREAAPGVAIARVLAGPNWD